MVNDLTTLGKSPKNPINLIPADNTPQPITMLGVSIAGQNWLIDMVDIGEVMMPRVMTHIPLVKPWIRGVMNVRGCLYCITDIAAYLQLGVAADGIDNRLLLIAEHHVFNAAILVDKVIGLRDTNTWHYDSSEYRDEHNIAWRKLDIGSLLKQPDFLQIGV